MINSIAANARAAAADQSGSTQQGNSPSSTSALGSSSGDLFLSILVAELKSQDPTSPLDPNQMVGQMLSMNQLNELIQIRQILGGVTTPAQGGTTQQPTGAQ